MHRVPARGAPLPGNPLERQPMPRPARSARSMEMQDAGGRGSSVRLLFQPSDLFESPMQQEPRAVQYVARPPERSKVAPVENEQSSEASHAIMLATSSGWPIRFIGIFAFSDFISFAGIRFRLA